MLEVLHQLIDRVGFHSEAEVRSAHDAVDRWFDEHFPANPAPSNVDSPAPGSVSASTDAPQGSNGK
jgi:hypothetical protein